MWGEGKEGVESCTKNFGVFDGRDGVPLMAMVGSAFTWLVQGVNSVTEDFSGAMST